MWILWIYHGGGHGGEAHHELLGEGEDKAGETVGAGVSYVTTG